MRYLVTFLFALLSLALAAQQARIDSLKNLLKSSTDTSLVNVLLALSNEYSYNDPEKAREYLSNAYQQSQKIKYSKGEVNAVYQIGAILMSSHDRDSARYYFEIGLKKSQDQNDAYLTALGFYHLSRYYEIKNDFTSAREKLKESLTLFENLGLKKNMANCYTSFGRICQETGNYPEALRYYFQSMRIKEELNDQRGISVLHTNIGNVYLNTSKFDEAADHFKKALAIDKINNDQEGIFVNGLNLGVSYQKKGLYEDALKNYEDALAIAKKLGYKEDEALLLGNIGSTLRQQRKPEKGLSYLFEALELENKFGFNDAHTLNDIAETYLELKQPADAKKYAELAAESSTKKEDLNQSRYALLNLARSFEMLGDFKNAYESLIKSHAVKDSMFTIEKAKQMDELGVQYETEKKAQTIQLLTQQNEAANFRRNAYLAAGIFLTVILLLLFNYQRIKSKKNRQLFEKTQEVEKMKSSFFSNISHEFRTPLTLILGPIEMLKSEINDPRVNSQLKLMEANANRLLALINQILDLSKLEAGKLKLDVSRQDIVTLVRGVTMTFHSLAEWKKIDLEMNVEPERLELDFDKEKMETILINLLSNAFKFTADGGKISVLMNTYKDKKQEEHCRIIVRDTGKGIAEKDLPHIFDRFYQSANAKDIAYEGSGIGLSLSKELVELHKGTIEVQSKETSGTDMTISLPVLKDAIPAPAGQLISKPQLVLANGNGKKQESGFDTILAIPFDNEEAIGSAPLLLVVEDNESVMSYLEDILRKNYQLLKAKDGEEGIALAMECIPDLIISDVMMPGKNGYELCGTLKKDEKTSHIPIILLTAKASLDDKMQGLHTKADEYLVKPFIPKELLIRAQNLVESRRQLREKYNRELVLKPGDVALSSIDETFLKKVMKVVEDNMMDEQFSIEKLGREVGMSRSQIHRKLHALTNQSATQFIRGFRLKRALDMIRQNAGSISEIGYWVGFSSPAYFSKVFLEEYGFTPTEAKTRS